MVDFYGKKFSSRLMVGTALYPSPAIMQQAIRASGAGIVTVALRRETAGGRTGSRFWELIRALDKGRDRFIGIEHETDTEIEDIRAEVESECADDGALKEDEIGNMKRLQKDGG